MVRTPPPSDSETPESLTIENFSLRVFAFGLFFLVIAVVWMALAVLSLLVLDTSGVFLFTLMVFLSLFFGGQAMLILGPATTTRLSDRPVLVIDHEGIKDHSMKPAAGRLRWDEIERIESTTYFGHSMLGITPTDLFAYLAHQHPLTRLLMWNQLVSFGAPHSINMNRLPISHETLLAAIDKHEPKPGIDSLNDD